MRPYSTQWKDAMEEGTGGLAAAAILALAGRFVAGLAGLEALEFASGVVFIAMVPMAAVGYGLRAWRWARRGQSINRRGVEGGGEP